VSCQLHAPPALLQGIQSPVTIGPRRKWEDNIKMSLKETRWEGGCELDSIGSGQGPVASSCEYGNKLSGFIKFWEFFSLLEKDSGPLS
jgi:hypothetical protein